MSRRHRNDEAPVSLFPFLAVLICTMGVLIVLLVLAVKAADTQSAEVVEAEAAGQRQLEELQFELEDQQLKNDLIAKQRPQLQQQLSREISQRGHVEEEIRQLRETLEQELVTLKSVQEAPDESELVVQQDLIEDLTEAIDSTSEEIENSRREIANQRDEYSLVPYEGGNGTGRKPIYVECTPDGLVLQPYDIKLDQSDFTLPLLSGNPLDTALLAIRQHMSRMGLTGENGSAYPLLVIRPGGEGYFALARRAMLNWDDEFGYELIEFEKKLNYGEPDPKLAEALQVAINDSIRMQANVVRQMQAQGQQFQKIGSAVAQVAGSAGTGTGQAEFSSNQVGSTGGRANSSESQLSQLLAEHNSDSNASTLNGGGRFGESNDTQSENSRFRQASSSNSGGTSQATHGPGGSSASASSPSAATHENRGSNWALPSSTSRATAYRRPIQIVCNEDEILIVAGEYSSLPSFKIPLTGSVEGSIDQFVQSVWTVIDSWGIAGSNGYWKPIIEAKVGEGGDQHLRQLKFMLRNSGLEFE